MLGALKASEANAVAPTFIRVTEVWTMDPADGRLHLSSGLYGELDAFAAVSCKESFARGEGLPGHAWDEARPVVLKGFRGSWFKRTEAAEAAGLTAGIAVPVFGGDELKGVVTFLFGDDDAHVGAVEVWRAGDGDDSLRLADGYFGTADHFEWISRHTRFPKGQGLPGTVWKTGGAVLFDDLGASHRFLRSQGAAEAGLTAGLGFPVPGRSGETTVVTLLSALGTPIARRFEVWTIVGDGKPVLADGVSGAGSRLSSENLRAEPGAQKVIAEVAASGVPVAARADASSIVALPIHTRGAVAEVAAWYF